MIDPIVDVAFHELSSKVNEDALRMAVARRTGEPYRRSWFRAPDPKTGDFVVVRAVAPEDAD